MTIQETRDGAANIAVLAAGVGESSAGSTHARMTRWAAPPLTPAQDEDEEAFANIDAYSERMGRLGDAIFSYSEIGFQEYKTNALVTKELKDHGFTVQNGVAGMPTAYMATYGSGSPKIGLMSEYDGVPGASQKPTSFVHDHRAGRAGTWRGPQHPPADAVGRGFRHEGDQGQVQAARHHRGLLRSGGGIAGQPRLYGESRAVQGP